MQEKLDRSNSQQLLHRDGRISQQNGLHGSTGRLKLLQKTSGPPDNTTSGAAGGGTSRGERNLSTLLLSKSKHLVAQDYTSFGPPPDQNIQNALQAN
jgi:hypothetical protein